VKIEHLPIGAACLLLMLLREICSTIHIIGYALYAAFDAAVLWLTKGIDR
jgi:hypothetical protein